MGTALAAALDEAGVRGARAARARRRRRRARRSCCSACPIARSRAAAAAIAPGPIVGHVSASAPLDLLAPHERFALHPLLSVVGAGAQLRRRVPARSTAARDARSTSARALAGRLGMHARVVPREQRALYHAAASAASNFLVTVEGMAERLATLVGLERTALVPLVRATRGQLGARRARAPRSPVRSRAGIEETAARQRAAVSESRARSAPTLGCARGGDARARRRAGDGRGMKIIRTVTRAARRGARGARARGAHRARAHDGRVPRGTPRAHAARARALRASSWCRCS